MKTVIYTQRVDIIEAYQERRDCADQRIADFIYSCGYMPIPMPNKIGLAGEMVNILCPVGIVLTGGNSLEKYGGAAPERDAIDRELIGIAIKKSIPLYGYCRGMQSILDYFGNRLINVEGHVAVRHLVFEGTEEYEVNSYHNQACVKLEYGSGLNVVAQAEDGVIEAVSHKELSIAACMWHPEREKSFQNRDKNRINALFGRGGKNNG